MAEDVTTNGTGPDEPVVDTELLVAVHRLSNEAFSVAKDYVGGKNPEDAKQRAREMEGRIPAFGAKAQAAAPAIRADLNRALSDARLDLSYVLSDGRRPSSTRLHYFQSQPEEP
ncbi:MAG TPA: hypothetical protein VN837_13615 [Chloroflexota bacterium]|nr:hypothetical protein [Chloroflexota bacterium]